MDTALNGRGPTRGISWGMRARLSAARTDVRVDGFDVIGVSVPDELRTAPHAQPLAPFVLIDDPSFERRAAFQPDLIDFVKVLQVFPHEAHGAVLEMHCATADETLEIRRAHNRAPGTLAARFRRSRAKLK